MLSPKFFDPWGEERRRHHHHHYRVLFTVNGVGVFLSTTEVIQMSLSVSVGHKVSMGISYLDQNGNPMLTTPTPDSPPTWTDTTPATGTLVVDPSGLTAVETAVAVGGDTVNLTVIVGGQSFAASLDLTVTPVPQVLTSVAITETVS